MLLRTIGGHHGTSSIMALMAPNAAELPRSRRKEKLMGTWSEGVYENDVAADYVYGVMDKMLEQIQQATDDPAKLEPDEDDSQILLCNVDLLAVLADHVYRQVWFTWRIRGPLLPAADTILDWKAKYLAAWDKAIDGLDPDPEYKAGHRRQIVATFDRLAELSRRQDEGPDEPSGSAERPRD
jgi:hypothetical protein